MEDKKYIKQLMKEMIPLKKMWGGLATVKIANDEELLDLAAESGCKGLLLVLKQLTKMLLMKQEKILVLQKNIKMYVKRCMIEAFL